MHVCKNNINSQIIHIDKLHTIVHVKTNTTK